MRIVHSTANYSSVWFQNRRAKFRRNERSVLTQRGSAFNAKSPDPSHTESAFNSRSVPSPISSWKTTNAMRGPASSVSAAALALMQSSYPSMYPNPIQPNYGLPPIRYPIN